MFNFKKMKLKLIYLFFVAVGSTMFNLASSNQIVNADEINKNQIENQITIDKCEFNRQLAEYQKDLNDFMRDMIEYNELDKEIKSDAEKAPEEKKQKLEQLVNSLKTIYSKISRQQSDTISIETVINFYHEILAIFKKNTKYISFDFDQNDACLFITQHSLITSDVLNLTLLHKNVTNPMFFKDLQPNDKINVEIIELGPNNIIVNRNSAEAKLGITRSGQKFINLINCPCVKNSFKENVKYVMKLIKNGEEILVKEFTANLKEIDDEFLSRINLIDITIDTAEKK